MTTARFFAQCVFDAGQIERASALRGAHLRHILANRAKVVYGGLTLDDDVPTAVFLFLDVATAKEAAELVNSDPYAETYSSIVISRFDQRLPEDDEGALARTLDTLG